MSRLLTTLAWVAPRAVARRVQAARLVEATSRYAGAAGGRRASSWTGRHASANVAVGTHLATLRNRSRELVRDHWAFARILDVLVSHTVGHGIQVRADNGSDRVDRRAEAAFADWAEEADVTGEQNLHGLIALSFRAMLEGGESLVRFVDLPASDPRRVKLGLQVWEGDVIDAGRDGPTEGRQVRLGVALGRYGQREGYYLFPEHPGENLATRSGGAVASRFTPRADVIHLYRELRPGQVRGVPAFAPVLLQARDLYDLMEATIVKARVEACLAGFVETDGTDNGPLTGTTQMGEDLPGLEMEPGMVTRLRPGERISFANPSSSGNFQHVHNATLYAMAAGAGVTFDQLTGDLRQANYSSLRAGKIEFRRMVEQMQWLVLEPKLLRRITARWSDRAVLAGVLPSRRDGYRWRFVMPANEPIDPKKDMEADILAVRAGRMSPQEFIAGWGRDYREVLRDFREFLDAADGAGLVFDIDPRATDGAGKARGKSGDKDPSDDADQPDDDQPPTDKETPGDG